MWWIHSRIVHYTKEDHSVGRSTDGAADFKLFTNPTPNATNVGAQDFYTPTPYLIFMPDIILTDKCKTLHADPSAQIRYTTDGSDPTASSTLYSGPISVSNTQVIRAAAFGANLLSFNETNTYFINETHGLPIVSVAAKMFMTW